MTKPKSALPEAKLGLYDRVFLATNPEVVRKGATSAYTSLNGHMYSFLTKQGQMALRLPKEEREKFLEEFDTDLCVQYGAVMKEYVVVPDRLLEDTASLAPFFAVSYAYVGSLKPKPTTRKKKQTVRKKSVRKK